MKVRDFIDDFLKVHRIRYVPHDWPVPDSEEWHHYRQIWIDAFIARKVQKHEADTASVRCGQNPPRFRNDHLVRILGEIEALRLANQILNVPDERFDAQQQSIDCEHCDGAGLRIVWHPQAAGRLSGRIRWHGKMRAIPAYVVATCNCVFGRWIRDHLDGPTKVLFPELQRAIDGQSEWRLHGPFDGEELHDPPTCIRDILHPGWREQVTTYAPSNDILRCYDETP